MVVNSFWWCDTFPPRYHAQPSWHQWDKPRFRNAFPRQVDRLQQLKQSSTYTSFASACSDQWENSRIIFEWYKKLDLSSPCTKQPHRAVALLADLSGECRGGVFSAHNQSANRWNFKMQNQYVPPLQPDWVQFNIWSTLTPLAAQASAKAHMTVATKINTVFWEYFCSSKSFHPRHLLGIYRAWCLNGC